MPEESQVRPWVRFWAKIIDLYLWWMFCCLVIYGLINITGTSPYIIKDKELAIGLAIMTLWIFYEAALLHRFSTTPGKWLLNTRVVPVKTKASTYRTAVFRSFRSTTEGLAVTIPLISILTALMAMKKLINQGSTTWDRRYGFRVVHQKLSILKLLIAVILFFAFLFIAAFVLSLCKIYVPS
ncbi:MAG: RDD family protein [Syntrophomonadaceae bacterium]